MDSQYGRPHLRLLQVYEAFKRASEMTARIILQIFSRFKRKSVPIIVLKCLPQQSHANPKIPEHHVMGLSQRAKEKFKFNPSLIKSLFRILIVTNTLVTP